MPPAHGYANACKRSDGHLYAYTNSYQHRDPAADMDRISDQRGYATPNGHCNATTANDRGAACSKRNCHSAAAGSDGYHHAYSWRDLGAG